MGFAQVGQVWLATFSLDPAICRDFVQYMRALSTLFSDEQAEDPECFVRRSGLEYLIGLGHSVFQVLGNATWREPLDYPAQISVDSR